jgi:hypothetical protein
VSDRKYWETKFSWNFIRTEEETTGEREYGHPKTSKLEI